MITLYSSPIEIENIQFSHVNVSSNPSVITGMLAFESIKFMTRDDIELSVEFTDFDPNENVIAASIGISSIEAVERNLACFFSISCAGKFTMQTEVYEDTKSMIAARNFVRMNATNILYGMVRAKLYEVTSAMPYGAVILPTCTMKFSEDEGSHENTNENADRESVSSKAKNKRKRKLG